MSKRLIYQVSIGASRLYDGCRQSVIDYADFIGVDYTCERAPILKIRPNANRTNRSKEAVERLGYLPIYEKAVAFNFMDQYDEIAIIDADVYIRPDTAENIFDQLLPESLFCAMREDSLPALPWYQSKLVTYSRMQYGKIWPKPEGDIYPFRNMGVMLFRSDIQDYMPKLQPTDTSLAQAFIQQDRFRDFVDGMGHWKWSTDQTLLNHWLYTDKIPINDLDWRWNCLYKTVRRNDLKKAYAVHFFLKDKLPSRGEDFDALMRDIELKEK